MFWWLLQQEWNKTGESSFDEIQPLPPHSHSKHMHTVHVLKNTLVMIQCYSWTKKGMKIIMIKLVEV